MLDKIKSIIIEYIDDEEIIVHERTNIRNDLDLDSLDLMSIVMEVEDAYNISFSIEDMAKITTVNDVMEIIKEKTA